MSKTLEQIIGDQADTYEKAEQMKSLGIVTALIDCVRNNFQAMNGLDLQQRQRKLNTAISSLLKNAPENGKTDLYTDAHRLTLAIAHSLWSDIQQVMESTSA